jgi:hypothetical protein
MATDKVTQGVPGIIGNAASFNKYKANFSIPTVNKKIL